MLERLSISGYSSTNLDSKNARSADNQQERLGRVDLSRILRDCTPESNTRWTRYSPTCMATCRSRQKCPAHTAATLWSNNVSEIPCRVSNIARGGSDPVQVNWLKSVEPYRCSRALRVIPRVRSSSDDPRNDSGVENPGWRFRAP